MIAALTTVMAAHSRWGFWKCYRRLRLDGVYEIGGRSE
ncbi:MAG: hypothetical protein OJF50_000452 [Nitrospira sp.]|nr:hypothetical protein [Nitrospira sp.]